MFNKAFNFIGETTVWNQHIIPFIRKQFQNTYYKISPIAWTLLANYISTDILK